MTTLEDHLPRFPKQDLFSRRVGKGHQGKVFVVSRKRNLVAKVYSSYYPNALELAQHEYHVADCLYRNGISVPRPEGVFEVSFPWRLRRHPAFVMEQICGGICMNKLCGLDNREEYNFARKLQEEEAEKAERLGFIAEDVVDRNCIYFPREKKVLLYDFLMWRAPDTPPDWKTPSLPLHLLWL